MLRIARSVVIACLFAAVTLAAVPRVGDSAPQFSLPASTGATVALQDYLGNSKVVLVFYRGNW